MRAASPNLFDHRNTSDQLTMARRGFNGSGLEAAVLCALALLAAILQLPSQHLRPRFSDDSFQYLSAADQIRSTQRMATSLVHFDTERLHGKIPAPLTWFPPGYPLAIAAGSVLGLSYETAALVISIACFVFVAFGLWRLMRMLVPSQWAPRFAVFCWIANSYALIYSVSALSESMFTAFGLASILFLVHTDDRGAGAHNTACWAASGIMAGASYWVRYAGVLWVGMCFMLLVGQLILSGNKRRPSLGAAIFAATALLLSVMPLMVRNIILVGDWRGGNNTPATMPIQTFLIDTPRILYHLIVGDGAVSQLSFSVALLAGGLIGLCIIAVRGDTAKLLAVPREMLSAVSNVGIVLAALLIYAVGIAAIAMRSVISYSPRMFFPVLPYLIALVVYCGDSILRRLPPGTSSRATLLALCSFLGYTTANVVSRISIGPDGYLRTETALIEADEKGRSIKQLLDQELRPREVIAATNGQAAGYILKHPTLSLVGPPYTLLTWNAPELSKELARFGATHLLIFRSAEFDPVVVESPFLRALAAGSSPPWLQLDGFNRDVYIYHVQLGHPR